MKETLLQRCQRETLEEYQKRYILGDESLIETLNKTITNTLKQAAEEIGKSTKTCMPATLICVDIDKNEFKYEPQEGGMYCMSCERFMPEEGCLCGMISITDAQKLLLGEDNE